MIHVQEFNSIPDLVHLRPAWRQLFDQTRGASFFQSQEWLEVYWNHFGESQHLRLLVATQDDRAVGILPLVVRREDRRVGAVRILTYPLDDWGSYYGPIGPRPEETLQAALEHIQRTPKTWDMLELRWVDVTGTDQGHTARALREAGCNSYPSVHEQTAIVQLTGTWESYQATRSRKWRSNYRRWEKKLRDTNVSFERVRPRGEEHDDSGARWDIYEACESIAEISWQGSSTNGTTLTHPKVRPFFREEHEAAARRGMVDMNLMRLNGEPVAFAYNYVHDGQVYGLRTGFDPSVSTYDVGNLLFVYLIRDSFRRGDRVVNLGPGSLERKRHFTTRVDNVYQYTHFRPTAARAQLLRLKRVFKNWLYAPSGQLLHAQDA